MYLCAGIVSALLPEEFEDRLTEQILFFPESVWTGGVLLRLLYTGSVQDRVLYDYFSGLSAPGTSGADARRLDAKTLLCGCRRRLWGVFCTAFEGNVCRGCKTSSLSELDLQLI